MDRSRLLLFSAESKDVLPFFHNVLFLSVIFKANGGTLTETIYTWKTQIHSLVLLARTGFNGCTSKNKRY